jgi:hypothetical protein
LLFEELFDELLFEELFDELLFEELFDELLFEELFDELLFADEFSVDSSATFPFAWGTVWLSCSASACSPSTFSNSFVPLIYF